MYFDSTSSNVGLSIKHKAGDRIYGFDEIDGPEEAFTITCVDSLRQPNLDLFLTKKVNDIGFKNLGFNITKLSSDYVEFRYAGGDIPKEVLIDKVKYCAFVVYCMTNPEYKKREYTKKLYKFIDTL